MPRSSPLCAEHEASASAGSRGMEHPKAIASSGRSLSWDRKEPQAIVYDPSKQALSTLSLTTLERMFSCRNGCITVADRTETSEKFEVHLPPWRNRVDIYLNEKAREGFVATVHLDRLGSTKNWQRRLRHNYTSLYVKGAKPGETSRTSSVSMAT